MVAEKKTPVTLLTGFLGAGKTTLLRHLLRTVDAEKVVVIENEFGAANIDSEFLEEIAPGMIRRVNGCICCAVEIDLTHTFESLLDARDAGTVSFERIILETTGMAEPGALAEALTRDDRVGKATRIDAIVTVVDARHITADLSNSPIAQAQIAMADLLVLNKTDLVAAETADEVTAKLLSVNPLAACVRTQFGEVAPERVLDTRLFERSEKVVPHQHFHDEVQAHLLEDVGPHDIRKVRAWLSALRWERADDLYRYKGVLNAAGRARRITLQGVHDLFALETARPWREDEIPGTTLVFIGYDLDAADLQRQLEACRSVKAQRAAQQSGIESNP